MSARAWRRRVGSALGRFGLLGAADRVLMWLCVARESARNRRFALANPGFATPPRHIAFDALGHVSSADYLQSGGEHAAIFARLIGSGLGRPAQLVLEWGCGPGRIIRNLRGAGIGADVQLLGVDVHAPTIAWCSSNIRGVDFRLCGPLPPLPVAARSVDALYSYSVWTHLSESSIESWVREGARVLRDDGLMIGTSHGDRYADMLEQGEVDGYRAGQPVVHRGAAEGRKRFLGFHPPGFIEALLARYFERVQRIPPEALGGMPQDVWCAQVPRRP